MILAYNSLGCNDRLSCLGQHFGINVNSQFYFFSSFHNAFEFNLEISNCRELMEIKESERRAHSQAEVLRNALEEHSLELRVKAANEAEAACQQRLSAAEAEIADLRAKLDASERFFFSHLIPTLFKNCMNTRVFF
jgi:hypothetical protein